MAGFTVAIVGRPNVGKSTLFNRLLEQRKAIVDNISGVTRDRQYGVADWNGKTFNVIDTGGFVSRSEDVFEREIRKQVLIALDEADLLMFIVDTATGITSLDDDMADLLRRSTKPVLLVVNKVDNSTRMLEATEFYAMGFDKLFFVSAISGSGTGELLDEITAQMPDDAEMATPNVKRTIKKVRKQLTDTELENEWENDGDNEEDPEEFYTEDYDQIDEENKVIEIDEYVPKIAIIGQPNAGKSTLLNALTGEERTIVSNIPGTTRDSIHTHYKLFGKEFVLIDTAGLRKKKNVHENLEFYSVIRAIRAMDEADICLMVIDALNGITMQDINIFSLAARKGKGIEVLVNKWDAFEKETNTARDYEQKIKEKLAPFNDVPVVFISAMDKTRIFQAMEKTIEVHENLKRRIQTSKLNETMLKEIQRFPPPMSRGHNVSIKFVRQLPTKTPSFACYANYPEALSNAYRNFIENKLRGHYKFSGVPLRIYFRKK
ncbi:MAG: ribosome biogenesis GTPase Der [Chitinophagaceae bacterium]|nr:ribosome biogenesis GTPase Der [Chitinophagaceae bacterium]